jgi:hypothetical protein
LSDNPYKDKTIANRQKQQGIVDEIIREAMKQGEFEGLPGAGKPLELEDDMHVPEDLRLAHRILKQNGMTPEWIALGKQIDATYEAALEDLRAAFSSYRGRRGDALRSQSPQLALAEAEAAWTAAQSDFRAVVTRLNAQLLNYNLKVPRGFPRRALLSADKALASITGRTS